MIPTNHTEKMREKKEFYDSNAIQSIKSELLNNNTTISASSKVYNGQEQNFTSVVNSYEEDDYNNDNIDVETDSDNDQQITGLKQMNYHNLSDVTVKHEEWSKIVKSTLLKAKSVERVTATANDSHPDNQNDPHDEKVCIASETTRIESDEPSPEKCPEETRTSLKRTFLPEDDESEYFTDTFTSHNLLNLSDKKRGRYGSSRGFSIENLIGRMVEDR